MVNRKRRFRSIIVVAIGALLLPSAFNACGQQNYEIALQGSSVGGLANGNEGSAADSDSSADNTDLVGGEAPTLPGPDSGIVPDTGNNTNLPPVVPPPGSPEPPQYNYVAKTLEINVNAINKAADILMVIDNSGSMAYEQESMANRFSSFLSEIQSLDWQLGIVTTDVTTQNDLWRKDGRLLPFRDASQKTSKAGVPYGQVLKSSQGTSLVQELFVNTIQRKNESGSGNEQGVFATHRFLERYFSLEAENDSHRALLRADATLSVIVITDANETPANGNWEARNTGAQLIETVKNQLGETKRFFFHSIIVKPGDEACKNISIPNYFGNEGYGTEYSQLSAATNGLVGSVCETDYGSQLRNIGKLVAESVKTVKLQCAPVDTNNDGLPDLKITVENGDSPSVESISGKDVVLTQELPLGKAKFEYVCLE